MTTLLAIETSCDDSSVAILKDTQVLCNLVASQTKAHAKYGGVVPELASRMHTEALPFLIQKATQDTQIPLSEIEFCAVTTHPGLEGSLLIGQAAASALAQSLNIPLLKVNHLHGHIYAAFLSDSPPQFPFIACIVSGGHTQLYLAKAHFQFELIGKTRDDAAGECFDKIARALKLGYPGGPLIEKIAQTGNPNAISFPRAMKKRGLEFSFSGLKTAVIQFIETNPETCLADICASFQAAVIDTLTEKCLAACNQHQCKSLVVCGGVSANQALKRRLQLETTRENIRLHVPPISLCTDNAAMIGGAAYFSLKKA
jgi:N6-L-threonylcarbamoyladenine synthase